MIRCSAGPEKQETGIGLRVTPMRLASVLLPLIAAASSALLAGDDLFDPAEAEKYRRRPGAVTDELLAGATSQPAGERPQIAASTPDSPFAGAPRDGRDAMPGYIELSDGRVLAGAIWTTPEKPWSVFEAESKSFRRIPPAVVRGIEAEVLWERDEPEWRWKEGGSDEKIYTGRTYPARMLRYVFTLANGEKVAGTVQQPIYVQVEGGQPVQFILHERDKGPLDGKLSRLVYVRRVCLGEEALARGRDLAAKSPATRKD